MWLGCLPNLNYTSWPRGKWPEINKNGYSPFPYVIQVSDQRANICQRTAGSVQKTVVGSGECQGERAELSGQSAPFLSVAHPIQAIGFSREGFWIQGRR